MVRNIEETITQQAAPGVLGIDWWTVKDSYFDNNVTWMNQKRFDVSCVKGSVRHVFVALAITIEENSLPLTSLSLVFSPVFYPAITLLFLFSVTHLPKTLTRLRCRSPTTGHFLKHTHTHTDVSAWFELADSGGKLMCVTLMAYFTRSGWEKRTWMASFSSSSHELCVC